MQATTDYGRFKFFESNRKVTLRSDLLKSIKEQGQIIPIVVNKDHYVVDGQHRLAACKSLSLPINYVINHDLDESKVVAANTTQKRWTLLDYIESHSLSNPHIMRLLDMVSSYPDFPVSAVAAAFSLGGIKSTKRDVLSGSYKFNSEGGHSILRMVRKMSEEGVKSYKSIRFVRALKQVIRKNPSFDIDILISKMEKKKLNIYSSEYDTAQEICDVYNWNTRNNSSKIFV